MRRYKASRRTSDPGDYIRYQQRLLKTLINALHEDLYYWKENGTVEAAGKLWYACNGAFDDEPGWEVNLEQMYMEMCEYTYRATDGRRKGCFSRTIGQRKTDIIKMINRASEKTHHGVIRMKRLPEEMDAKTEFKK